MMPLPSGEAVAAAIATRQAEVVSALQPLDDRSFMSKTRLPGWDRLTIACHLRYGAVATDRITRETLAGRPAAFYPAGRDRQRPATLRPDDHELPSEVVTSLQGSCGRLDALLAGMEGQRWHETASEPRGNADLGPIDLWTLALLRLTEVEVHGEDLDLELSPWSSTFVTAALPTRLMWLPRRRSNHRRIDHLLDGTWGLRSTDGASFRIAAHGDTVEVEETPGDPAAEATMTGTSHQLLAFILGRVAVDSLEISGNLRLAESFLATFPAP